MAAPAGKTVTVVGLQKVNQLLSDSGPNLIEVKQNLENNEMQKAAAELNRLKGETFKLAKCNSESKENRSFVKINKEFCQAMVLLKADPCLFGQCQNKRTKDGYCQFHLTYSKRKLVKDYTPGDSRELPEEKYDSWLTGVVDMLLEQIEALQKKIYNKLQVIRAQHSILELQDRALGTLEKQKQTLVTFNEQNVLTSKTNIENLQRQLNDSKSALTMLNEMIEINNALLISEIKDEEKAAGPAAAGAAPAAEAAGAPAAGAAAAKTARTTEQKQ